MHNKNIYLEDLYNEKIISMILSLVMVCAVSIPSFAVEEDWQPRDVEQTMSAPRLRETIVAKRPTNVWQKAPYSSVDNTCIAIASTGSEFNYRGNYVDVYGTYWYKVSIISVGDPNLVGAEGYVLASDCTFVVG